MHFFARVQLVHVALESIRQVSECDLMLPVGKSCGFGSAVPVLMIHCMSPAIFVRSEAPCMPTCMFGMTVWFLGSTWSCIGRLSGLIGELGRFVVS